MRSWREFDCSNRTQRTVWMLNGGWQTDRRSREKSLHELEFNNLNIHRYLRLNHGTALEHFKYSAQTLYGALWCLCGFYWGLTTAQNSIRTISDLDLSRLTDTRSAENDRIGADTDPAYWRILHFHPLLSHLIVSLLLSNNPLFPHQSSPIFLFPLTVSSCLPSSSLILSPHIIILSHLTLSHVLISAFPSHLIYTPPILYYSLICFISSHFDSSPIFPLLSHGPFSLKTMYFDWAASFKNLLLTSQSMDWVNLFRDFVANTSGLR